MSVCVCVGCWVMVGVCCVVHSVVVDVGQCGRMGLEIVVVTVNQPVQ